MVGTLPELLGYQICKQCLLVGLPAAGDMIEGPKHLIISSFQKGHSLYLSGT